MMKDKEISKEVTMEDEEIILDDFLIATHIEEVAKTDKKD